MKDSHNHPKDRTMPRYNNMFFTTIFVADMLVWTTAFAQFATLS